MPLVAFISLTALGNIPCTIRDSLKHVAGRSFNFKADGNRYVLDVYRGHNTTVMGGNDWVKFVTDFNLGAGSYVVFDTSKRTAEAYVVHLGFGDFANDGESDEDVEGEGAGVEVFNIESDEDDHEEGDAQEVVYTQGCVLSGVEESLLDVVLANNDGQSPAGFNANEVSYLFSLTTVLMRAGESGTEEANTTGAGLSKLRAASLGGEAMEDGDGEQPDQLLQSKGNTESNMIANWAWRMLYWTKLRKILDTKETREIVRQKTLKRPRSSNELEDKANNGVVPKAYSRCSVPYFVDVVKTTRKSQSKVDLVKGIGFAYLLELDDSVVPRHFTQWVADKVKNESETCYGQENHQWASTKRYSYLKAAIERTVGDTLNEKVKEDIYLSFQQHMREEGPNTCSKVKNLILEVIQIVTRATCDSEKTLKIDSSANQHNSTNHGHDSEATVKVNSNGEYEEEDEGLLSRKRRRIAAKIKASTYQQSLNNLAKESTFSQESNRSVGSHISLKQKFTGAEPAVVCDIQGKRNNEGQGAMLKERLNQDCKEETEGIFNTEGAAAGTQNEVEKKHNSKHAITGSTTSFDYMLGHQNCEYSSFLQQDQGVVGTTISTFDFQNKCNESCQQTLKRKHAKLNIDMNEPFLQDEQQALTDNGSSDWARYLDEARQKYFFYSDNVQTIRLFENQDDSGTKINEPELWRPLGMSSKEYENKIQVAKNNGPRKSNEQAKRSSNKLNVPCDWARYLDEAREKYFFYTDDIPTLRLFENEDDNGTEIREQELWRPLGMSSEEYEKKIQMAKNNGPHKRTKEADNIDFNASPELQILGERSLQENCLNMLGNSDEHYNTRLLLGSTSSSIGKENVPTKRIVQPSRYLCSPYDNKDRGSLMIHEIELYNNLMILSRSADFKGRWVVEIDNTRVSMEQLGNSFREKGWVESYVINVFCRKLFRDNHPRTSQRHFFFHTASEYFLQKWKNEASRLQWRDRLIKSFIGAGKARDLQLCNELFFPTIHRSHWFVFLVDLSARKFIFLDSKYDGEHTFHKEIKQMMVENFKQLWNAAGLRNMGFRHYEIAYPNLPKQDGDDACGIFVLKWLENWRSRNAMQTVFRQEDVQDARIRLAIDILFSQHNILTEGKRIVKDF
ncbi:hypothetical protein D1007_11470 [Hordeum vulgare]|nr:hypothetical protein D1007_11470 [Hordeum vulgare]